MATDPACSLSDDDQLALWVGRLAREHALLEYGLSNVRGMLEPSEDGVAPPTVGGLVECCLLLLDASDLEADIVEVGRGALTAATSASALRNRVVHDMWLPDPLRGESEPARWNAFRREGRRATSYTAPVLETLQTVVAAHDGLSRSRVRVSGLLMALHELMPHGHTAGRPKGKSALPRYIAMMKGEFTVAANGDVEVGPLADPVD